MVFSLFDFLTELQKSSHYKGSVLSSIFGSFIEMLGFSNHYLYEEWPEE